MTTPVTPTESIFPILAYNGVTGEYRFIGTGYFVLGSGEFISAKHVLDPSNLYEQEEYVIAHIESDSTIRQYAVQNIKCSKSLDIAMGKAVLNFSSNPLEFAIDVTHDNEVLLSLDYSRTHLIRTTEGKGEWKITPSTQRGHTVRYAFTLDELIGSEKAHVLEISFPALKGASGAPVLRERDLRIVGMILRNEARELLPAQIEKVIEEDRVVEERKYFLPHAIAIGSDEIMKFFHGQLE